VPRAPAPDRGLPLGAQAPPFALAGLYGDTITLEALTAADNPVLLVFTDPGCGPCNALLPQIAAWQREHAGRLTIAVLTRGSADDNRAKAREHAISSVWLDDRLAAYDAYRPGGTPAGVLVDARGRIASAVAAGGPAIAALVAEAGRPPALAVAQVPARPTPSRPLPPQVGAPAPDVTLRDPRGEPIALTVPDRDTLLLFWNPGCGFCRSMSERVRSIALAPAPGSPRLIVVSTGSAADNEDLGVRAPIALDPAFTAGSAFGTTGTPSAILVDRHGQVASGLAIGAEQVIALAAGPSERVA
jgi:thiol-disulfide isomerase/thioredoxin